MEGIVAVTYRCNAKCHMCNTWQFPSDKDQEIKAKDLVTLPPMKFCNITGGETFLREDLEEIVREVRKKADRICISSNGYFTDRIVDLMKKNIPNVGIRISLEGLPKANDELRGLKDGFDHGLRTILKLKEMGVKDLGFGITISDKNAKDLLELYSLAKYLKLEFATAILHNGFYFHKLDNKITEKDLIIGEFNKLIQELFKTKRLKNWFRAYFNHGIKNYIRGNARLLPCEMGREIFLIDPIGDIKPCNACDVSMGNIKEKSFDEIWASPEAEKAREVARNCGQNCWMIGSVAPAIKKALFKTAWWVLTNRGKYLKGNFPDE
jgi:MoaA/NifB/PqqE/SkfB family radical SAM enzyme